jgi:glycosyltransferase involved in cell wall biosynthesis
MERPLVSVICLCYNHERFVEEAIESVLLQTYPHLQVIVVDDFSSDRSATVISGIVSRSSREIKYLPLQQNLGNCKAFNVGLKHATGDFIIDFSTDDIMLPNRVDEQVNFFLQQNEKTGVVFTDAVYIDERGIPFKNHFEHLFKKKLIDGVPTGDIFRNVLTTYFISSPTMMIKREVMESLGGYDESLAYEDFDFWVRSSRNFEYAFLNKRLTKVRKISGSMSSGWYEPGDPQLHSTYLVCKKAETLCRDEKDIAALRKRVLYEFRQSIFSNNKDEGRLFAQLLRLLGGLPFWCYGIQFLSHLPLPWSGIRKRYQQLFFG